MLGNDFEFGLMHFLLGWREVYLVLFCARCFFFAVWFTFKSAHCANMHILPADLLCLQTRRFLPKISQTSRNDRLSYCTVYTPLW